MSLKINPSSLCETPHCSFVVLTYFLLYLNVWNVWLQKLFGYEIYSWFVLEMIAHVAVHQSLSDYHSYSLTYVADPYRVTSQLAKNRSFI